MLILAACYSSIQSYLKISFILTILFYVYFLYRKSPRIPSVQYCGGCSVLWGMASVHVGDNISTAEAVQYCGGIASVLWRNIISTAGVHQYSGGIASVLRRLFSTAEG